MRFAGSYKKSFLINLNFFPPLKLYSYYGTYHQSSSITAILLLFLSISKWSFELEYQTKGLYVWVEPARFTGLAYGWCLISSWNFPCVYIFLKELAPSNPDLGMLSSQSTHLGPPCQVKRVSLANRGRLASYKHILKEVSVVYVFVAIQCMCLCRVFCYWYLVHSLTSEPKIEAFYRFHITMYMKYR